MERLFEILKKKYETNQGPTMWALNAKYCFDTYRNTHEASVRYSYESVGTETPFPVEVIKEIKTYANKRTFVNAYQGEKFELTDRITQDKRIDAIWSYYYSVKKGDVFIYGYGHLVIGYYIVTGYEIECRDDEKDENVCYHIWPAEFIRFDRPLDIVKPFEPPFFKLFSRDHMKALLNTIQGK